jgi:hypothetical protein
MEVDREKFPRTWFVDDSDIIDAIYGREQDGFSVTRSQSLADRLNETGKLDDANASDVKVRRELERRMLELVRQKKLVHEGGDYALVEPDENALYSLRLTGEKPDVSYRLQGSEQHRAVQMAETIGNLTGYRPEYILFTVLGLMQPGTTTTLKHGISPIRFIIGRSS